MLSPVLMLVALLLSGCATLRPHANVYEPDWLVVPPGVRLRCFDLRPDEDYPDTLDLIWKPFFTLPTGGLAYAMTTAHLQIRCNDGIGTVHTDIAVDLPCLVGGSEDLRRQYDRRAGQTWRHELEHITAAREILASLAELPATASCALAEQAAEAADAEVKRQFALIDGKEPPPPSAPSP